MKDQKQKNYLKKARKVQKINVVYNAVETVVSLGVSFGK